MRRPHAGGEFGCGAFFGVGSEFAFGAHRLRQLVVGGSGAGFGGETGLFAVVAFDGEGCGAGEEAGQGEVGVLGMRGEVRGRGGEERGVRRFYPVLLAELERLPAGVIPEAARAEVRRLAAMVQDGQHLCLWFCGD
ncbi:hypothetical protein OHA21_14240 [Actinoplanes sp. NBC_00393]|uniref:hypothetical protein n=1 Tax=Actinoplanes sp. NBC_00393 TaxID=2975953 RepID=UPI002E229832